MDLTYYLSNYGVYGYLALFIGTFLEGETILIIAGFAAYNGHLSLTLCILSAFLGSFAGDQTAFYIGRYNKSFLEKRLKKWECRIEKVHRLLEKHQVLVLISFRFFYGFRNITPFAVGTTNVSPWRFFALNGIGAGIWAISFGVGGYYLGDVLERFLQEAKWWVAGGLFGVILLAWVIKTVRNRLRAPRC
ncbi:MAG: DedA family protein [Proteobacteria bacterium]|nr:DedA family protein [Pseudomonadota bacterium]MBU1594431.1 DedA family protein [Pseudomonadota bacterium]